MRHSTLLEGSPILVVEHDPLQALDLADTLEAAGAVILGPVFNLEDAMRIARTGAARAAVMDFGLKLQNTATLAQELHRRQTPFIIHSGYSEIDRARLPWAGCRLISKPANILKLVKTVAALVRWRRLNVRAGASAPLIDGKTGR